MKTERTPQALLQPTGQTKRWLKKVAETAVHPTPGSNGRVMYQSLPSSSDDIPILIEEESADQFDDNFPLPVEVTGVIEKSPVNVSKRKHGLGHTIEQFNNNYGSVSSSPEPQTPVHQRKISRAVTKKGSSNLTPVNIESDGYPFLADMFTTVLEMGWPSILVSFCFTYFASWLFFAAVWYGIVYIHGDLNPENIGNVLWEPCISGFKDFTSAFLFSVETQHTTGYGYYHLTEQCASAVVTLCAQSIFGCILEGIMVGLLFVKISRAKKRSRTLMFSRTAVINQRDGQLCLMFRLADMRKSHLLDATVRAAVISKRTTAEGEEITISHEELEVGGDGEKSNKVLLFWPTTVIHRINASSPLYKLSAADLNPENTNFEIIVVLEGIVEATGLTTQAKSSYMPHEILWGHRFKNVTSSKTKSGDRVVDYSLFHDTVYVPTSPLSTFQMDTLSYSTSITRQELGKLATKIVTNAMQDSISQISRHNL